MSLIGLRFRYRCLSRFRICPERGFRILRHTCTGILRKVTMVFWHSHREGARTGSKIREGLAKPPYDKGNTQLPCVLSSSPLQFIGNVRQTRRRLLRLCAMLLKRNDSCMRICDTGFATSHARARLQSSRPVMGWHGSIVGPL